MSGIGTGAAGRARGPGITRRRLLKSSAALTGLAGGSGVLTGFPTIWAQDIKDVTLLHAGPPVAAIPKIGEQATKDLDFTIKMQATESADLLNRFLSQSSAIDVGDVSIVFMKYLVGRNVLQAIPVAKYKDWDKVIPLFSKGIYPNGSEASTQGVAPYTVLYATGPDGQKFANGPTEWLTGIPTITITNADTLGVRSDLVGRPIKSWADLISPEFKGKAALQDQPTVGVIDVALALEARGDVKYGNKGNMTRDEIDKAITVMMDVKKAGQFRSFWSTFDQAVNLMASGEVVIQSMWSPAVTAVKTRGIPCVYQPLQEGFRGWGYTLAPMKHLSGLKLDCFYEYMNWYTSGFQGAFIARQGYYSSIPDNAKNFLTEAEWDYWYGGKPAATDITDPYGKLMERAGGVRDGGAFWDRMGNIAAWNSVMDEDRYLTRVERVHHHVTTLTRPAAPLPRLLSPALPRRRVRSWLVSWLQVSPLAFILIVLFAMPTFLFAVVSFFDYDRTGIYPAFILDNYRDLLTTPATIRVYVSSLTFAVIVWAITLFLGFNIAHFLIFHVRSAAVRTVLFLLCAIPFWTSGIIRTIAWIPFLGRNGAFNQIVMGAGLTSQPVDFLLFSRFAVVITYVNLFTLLVVGPIANSLAKIDPALIEAARDAGASRWRVMVEVIIPLSKTGIALGSILVFTQVMGDFFVVKQMSGGQSASIVSALATEIQAMQYPPASASAVVLVCFVAILVAGMMRVVDVRKELVK